MPHEHTRSEIGYLYPRAVAADEEEESEEDDDELEIKGIETGKKL